MDHKTAFPFREKGRRLRRIVDGEWCKERHYYREKAFEDEDPAPSGVASDAVHFLCQVKIREFEVKRREAYCNAVRQQSGKCTGDTGCAEE